MPTSSDDVRSFLHLQYPPPLPFPCSSTYPILEVTQPPYTCTQPTRQPPDNFFANNDVIIQYRTQESAAQLHTNVSLYHTEKLKAQFLRLIICEL